MACFGAPSGWPQQAPGMIGPGMMGPGMMGPGMMGPGVPPPMAGPTPGVFGQTRYHYHTPDGGPPNDGKPPGTGASIPPYGFAPGLSGAAFGGQPPAPMGYYPGPPGGVAPPPAYASYPSYPAGSTAPGPIPTPPAASNFVGGPMYAPKDDDDVPAPGNRVNGRLARVDDGSGVLLPEHMTTFHVLNPGCHPERTKHFKRDMKFKVQLADSQWTVRYLIKQLGGLKILDRQPDWACREDLVAVEEWHELGNGDFRPGSTVHYNSPKAGCTLAEMGWGPDRGKAGGQPPVWLVLYPIPPM